MSDKGFTEPESMGEPVIGGQNGDLMEGSTLYTGENGNVVPPPPPPHQQHRSPQQVSQQPPPPHQPYWNGYNYVDQFGNIIPTQNQHNQNTGNGNAPMTGQAQSAPVDNGPKYCLIEFSDKFLIMLDVPGIDKNSIEIDFEEPRLTISGHRLDPRISIKDEFGDDVTVHDSTVKYGDFSRSLKITKAIENIDATLENGVLKIEATFRAIKPAKISIK